MPMFIDLIFGNLNPDTEEYILKKQIKKFSLGLLCIDYQFFLKMCQIFKGKTQGPMRPTVKKRTNNNQQKPKRAKEISLVLLSGVMDRTEK